MARPRDACEAPWSILPALTVSAPPRLRNAILVLLGVVTTASLAGTALSPYLLVKSPLLLVAMSPAAHHIAFSAATVDPVTLITLATVRRTLTSLGAFGLGYLYGPAAVTWLESRSPRLGRLVKWLEQLFASWGVLALTLAPIPMMCVLAGAARTRPSVFASVVVVALAFWNSVTYFVGDAIADWTRILLVFLDRHLLESTLVCAAAVLAQQIYQRLGKLRSKREKPSSS